MATWGAYLSSFVGKTTEEPLKDSSLTGSSSTVEKNQLTAESIASKNPPISKIAESIESTPRIEGVKKLYDLNPLPDSKLEQSPPKFNSNAARVAKLFGYGSPAAPAASESTAPLLPKLPTKPVAPTNSENLSTLQKSIVSVTPQPIAGLPTSVVTTTPENAKNDPKKPSGLLTWAFGSTAKTQKPIVETKDTKSSLLSATFQDQQTTASRNSVRMLSELQTSLQNVKIYNENILPTSEANLAPSELNGASTGLASKSIINTFNPSRFNVNAPTQSKFDSSHSNTSAFNSSRPESIASSTSASTRYNLSSGLSSPISRRDSIFSRFSTSSLRPFDNSLASVEEKVAREIRLQAEKEHRMKLMAFTKSIEEMRIEREKMESDRKRMMDEKAAFERDEYQLKDKEEQMRIFVADFEQEQEREIKEREQLRLEQEEEKRRQQEALRLENEEKIRKQVKEKEEQERIMLLKEKVAQQDDTIENKRNNSPIPNYNLDTERQLAKSDDKEELEKMSTNQEDEDEYSIYDEYYDEESDQEEENPDFQKQFESTLQDDNAKKQQLEEEEYEIELDRQRSLQASRLREEEEERRRYAEEQARRFRQQRPIQTGSPPEAPGDTPSQMKLPQMGLPQMGSPQMRLQMGSPQMRPQMGSPQMRPQMGSPQMRPQMGSPQMRPQMGSPQMRPQMGSPQMRSQMGSPQMRPQMGSPQMRSQMGSPQMRPQMGSPQMRPQMGSPQMRPQMRPQMGSPQMRPQMGSPQMRPQMNLPQIRPMQAGQRIEQRGIPPARLQQSEEKTLRRQQQIEDSEGEETDKEEKMRKAEIKMRKAFAEISLQKGTAPLPAQEFEVQPRPPRNQNPTYIRSAGGLPAGPRKGKDGPPARSR